MMADTFRIKGKKNPKPGIKSQLGESKDCFKATG